jgi:lycopene beta-cyclase
MQVQETTGGSITKSAISKKNVDFDYIIAGAGCAGMSLALHMIASGKFNDKQVLLVDRDLKKSNDRTWCFWERGKGLFEDIVYRQWQKLWFHGTGFSSEVNIDPYHYKMIRGIDFYNYCLKTIRGQRNFSVIHDTVEDTFSEENTGVIVNGERIRSSFVFNSILFQKPALSPKQYWLLQHFKGLLIETDTPVFDPEVATLMDFRMDQQPGTAFCYVLPFSPTRAMVEYTLFSPELLKPEAYDSGLEQYIGKVLRIPSYRILDQEFGVIPMTNFKFPRRKGNIINIGTAGGQTKGSSGYTFNFIQKHSAELVQQLHSAGTPSPSANKKRFSFYDSVLLNILQKRTLEGKDIFTRLFKSNKPGLVFKFLDNETSLSEDLRIISTLPTAPFTKAAIQQLF